MDIFSSTEPAEGGGLGGGVSSRAQLTLDEKVESIPGAPYPPPFFSPQLGSLEEKWSSENGAYVPPFIRMIKMSSPKALVSLNFAFNKTDE